MLKRIGLVMLGLLGLLVAIVLYQLLYGGTPDQVAPKSSYEIIAHRGLHTNWEKGTYDLATGCEAEHLYPLSHEYIENTLPAIAAAFDLGATIVEIDIRRTLDDELVIFHDFDLTCRTDGQGEVGDHPLEYLRELDIGHGYTSDGGQTYPLRGKGVGLMPTLQEVLQTYPDKSFLIDHKDGSEATADLLITVLENLPAEQQARLYIWGPPAIRAYIQDSIPAITPLFGTRPELKDCFLPYLYTLGLAGFPPVCEGMGLALPAEYLKYVPGWPYRFLAQVTEAGARFYIIVETESEARFVSGLPTDGVETDHIELVGPVLEP